MESFFAHSSSTSIITNFISPRISHSIRLHKSPPFISPSLQSIKTFNSSSLPSSFYPFNSKPSLKPLNTSIQASSPSILKTHCSVSHQGAKLLPLTIFVSIGLIVRYLIPKPIELSLQAWKLLSIFLSTITGLILSPLPTGAWGFIGLTTSILTKTLDFKTAFSGFTHEVIWLIIISFFFAKGIVKSGIGDRIATYFVKLLGKSTLGLSYGLTITEALIGQGMPSSIARAGGVFLPIIKSLSLSSVSKTGIHLPRELGLI